MPSNLVRIGYTDEEGDEPHLYGTRFDLVLTSDDFDYRMFDPVLTLDPARGVYGAATPARIVVEGDVSVNGDGASVAFAISAPAAALTPGDWKGAVVLSPGTAVADDHIRIELLVESLSKGAV